MNKNVSIIALFFLTFQGFAIDLEIPNRRILVEIPVGTSAGQLSFGPYDSYEPFYPSDIQTDSSGDFYVLDYKQGILRYSTELRFKEKISDKYQRMAVFNQYLVAWNPESDPQYLVVYSTDTDNIKEFAKGEISDIGKINMMLLISDYLVCLTDKDSVALFKLASSKLSLVAINDLSALDQSSSLSLAASQVVLEEIGIITVSAGKFFHSQNKSSLQYATFKGERDIVNLRVGNIFGVDTQGNRYIYAREKRIAIADKSGNLIKVFDIRAGLTDDVYTSQPSVASDGTIIYLESSIHGHKIVNIDKTW